MPRNHSTWGRNRKRHDAPKKRVVQKGATFWNKEYAAADHLALSSEPAEDLLKYLRAVARREGQRAIGRGTFAVDMGCGNGRNLIHLAKVHQVAGVGFDISAEAIEQARAASQGLPLRFETRSIVGTFPELKDGEADLVLDMMSSHVLREKEREVYLREIARMLHSGGRWLLKTFLLDGDIHAKRMLRDAPADEPDSYIHPRIGAFEHVWSEEKLVDWIAPYFEIEKLERSHKHLIYGRAGKRRSIILHLVRKEEE
jgi:SAM-dependent methyltransferase